MSEFLALFKSNLLRLMLPVLVTTLKVGVCAVLVITPAYWIAMTFPPPNPLGFVLCLGWVATFAFVFVVFTDTMEEYKIRKDEKEIK